MGNTPARGSLVETCSSYDEATINRGTFDRPRPLLKFHSIHGENVQLLNDGRIARRKESFCKGLAFSNRPIAVDEIVCLALCEVGTNWSGVLRFGVSNVDPASFRDIELPKFVCPDLTSKAGYWAKALAERYSIDKAILHFFVNADGELHYGINGVSKGLFLNGINVSLPLWIVVDIYGNSIGVEFVDPADVKLRSMSKLLREKHNHHHAASADRPRSTALSAADVFLLEASNGGDFSGSSPAIAAGATTKPMSGSTSASNLMLQADVSQRSASARTSPFTQSISPMRFHMVKGTNITLEGDDFVATRRHGEYYLGYVFSERPIQTDEKLSIIVLQTEEAFSGSLAFGLTSCDPIQVAASRLPVDSDDLLERPEYWVCVKDVAAQPCVGDRLSFRVDSIGQVFFAKNDAPPRVIMHVDISVKLWAFFDLYGTTGKIQLIENSSSLPRSSSFAAAENSRNHRASSEGAFATAAAVPNASTAGAPSSALDHYSSATRSGSSSSAIIGFGSSSAIGFSGSNHHPHTGGYNSHHHNLSAQNRASRSTRPASAALYLEQLRVALPPATTESSDSPARQPPEFLSLSAGTSGSEENLRTPTSRSIPIPTTGGGSGSSPGSAASSGSSSAPLGVDSAELARLRASITRRLNTATIHHRPSLTSSGGLGSAGYGFSSASSSSSPTITTSNVSQFHGGDDFDAAATRFSSLLSSRRRGHGGTSYSASPRPRETTHSAPLAAATPPTNNFAAFTTPTTVAANNVASTPSAAGFRSVLTEALECLNNAAAVSAASAAYTAPSTSSAAFSASATSSSARAAPKFTSATTAASSSISLHASEFGAEELNNGGAGGSECSICMNSRVNAVIYRCGHMCMCFACAKETHRRSGDCPICRTPIIDVIRCYPA